MEEKNFDVILVGGGVMGCATATYLLKADNRLKVAIIEKDLTYARASTPLSDGNTRVQFNIKENIQMSLYGLEVLERFGEEMAVGDDKPDVAFRQQGDLFLFEEDGRAGAKRGLALQQSLNCEVEWLTPEMLRQQYPLFNLESCVGGTFGRQDGTMDPYAMLIAYKKKAKALGAVIIEAEVAELLLDGKCMSGVRLSSGEVLKSNTVVNTAGAWATNVAQTIGVNLPVQATKRQVFVIETGAQPERLLPLVVFPSGLYLIQEHGGVFLCGKSLATDAVGTEDFSWDLQLFNDFLWPDLVAYVPSFDRLKVLRGWSGLYAVNTFDGNAILGEWPELQGLYLANGFSGHGFQQCHAVGRYLSELITGQTVTLDLSIFSPQRILDDEPVFESKRKLV
jgi:glycine/D-amino acid oxidase-like deaminating enzyme